ncbi:hypothetical protein Goari_026771 [Gossypium aridum]|uniref:Uncharacterized protein n=1 Tax=Gossypium aridum TaxID=34290 RepID=A0A7J8YPW8_GOSAI|nr:hypothetical protein [Gossypium aridum]
MWRCRALFIASHASTPESTPFWELNQFLVPP